MLSEEVEATDEVGGAEGFEAGLGVEMGLGEACGVGSGVVLGAGAMATGELVVVGTGRIDAVGEGEGLFRLAGTQPVNNMIEIAIIAGVEFTDIHAVYPTC